MATKLDSFDFRNSGARSKYPWDQWFDGSIWALTVGDDYPAAVRNFGSAVNTAGRKRGLKIRTQRTETGLVIQATNGQA